MRDTPAGIERKFQMLLQRSGEKRLKMGCSMHSTGPGLDQSLHLRKGPDCSEARVVLRFYGDEFQPKSKKIRALRTAADVIWYDTGRKQVCYWLMHKQDTSEFFKALEVIIHPSIKLT